MKINQIKNKVDKVYTRKQVEVYSDVVDSSFKFEIDIKFRKTKITDMLIDIMKRADMCKKEGLLFDYAQTQIAMIIKYFTNAEFKVGKDLKETYINECCGIKALIDAELVGKLMACFDEQELKKIEDMAKNMNDFSKKLTDIELDTIIKEAGMGDKENGESI